MTKTTAETDGLKFISHWIATLMIIMDFVTVALLSLDYVVPAVLALPEFELIRLLRALGIVAFLVFIQIFFVPVIAFTLDVPTDRD